MKLIPFNIGNVIQVQFMYDVRTAPEVAKNLFGNPPANIEQHITWLQKQRGIRHIFIITQGVVEGTTARIAHIGYCHIYNITNETVEVGWAFHPKYHSQGYGEEAVDLLIKACEEMYPTRDIELFVKNDNTPAVILYVKAKFIAVDIKDNILHMKKSKI